MQGLYDTLILGEYINVPCAVCESSAFGIIHFTYNIVLCNFLLTIYKSFVNIGKVTCIHNFVGMMAKLKSPSKADKLNNYIIFMFTVVATNICVCFTRELMDVIKVIGKRMSLAHPSGK